MSQGRLQSTIKHYRQQLKAHEAQAERALTYAHARTLETIQPQLDKLYREIAAKQQAGEDVPLSYLYEYRRLETVKQYVSNQIDHFGTYARIVTTQVQQQGVQLGSQAAHAQLQAVTPPHAMQSFNEPSPVETSQLTDATQVGSPTSALFTGFGAEAAKGVGLAFITGISLRQSVKQIATQVGQALTTSLYRAVTIAGNALIDAYRGIVSATYRANDTIVIGWLWIAQLGSACAACTAMHGTQHELGEDMDSHPHCLCTQQPITKNSADIQFGSDWFDEQDESTQREILGGKYNSWKNGDFTLEDVVGYSDDPIWGRSIYEKPLKALVK